MSVLTVLFGLSALMAYGHGAWLTSRGAGKRIPATDHAASVLVKGGGRAQPEPPGPAAMDGEGPVAVSAGYRHDSSFEGSAQRQRPPFM